jgi:hypothetical protein
MGERERIGEIVETGTAFFIAESFVLHQPPALGQLVYVETDAIPCIYGVVCYGSTASPDPGRRAVRRSTEGVYDDAIYREHPQLQRTLRTEFIARLVGYREEEWIHRYLPPQPPPLHYSVQKCTTDQVKAFTEHLTYLRLLLEATEVPAEQLLAAHIRQVYQARDSDEDWLSFAARQVAGLLKNDYDRLMTVLRGISP